MSERVSERVCVCVCVREREREREFLKLHGGVGGGGRVDERSGRVNKTLR